MDLPALDTARLTLRVHRREDFGECAAMWADPLVTRHIGGRPFTEEEVWTRLLRYVGHWSLLGYGYFAIRERASGRFVGEAGFADFKRDLQPPFTSPEAGWALASWAHGQGFAREALGAILEWGDAHFQPRRTVCMIHPDNRASIRLAEALGYSEYLQTTFKGSPTLLFQR